MQVKSTGPYVAFTKNQKVSMTSAMQDTTFIYDGVQNKKMRQLKARCQRKSRGQYKPRCKFVA